jgi:uncharacterized repeat protein (TIGR03847 family)
MIGRRFIFDPPDRFVAVAVGEPGHRAFYLQATKGRAVLSVGLEKVQVALLAERIGQLVEELARRGVESASGEGRDEGPGVAAQASAPRNASPADGERIVEAFRIGTMSLTYDGERRDVILDARELAEEGADGDAADGDADAEDADDTDEGARGGVAGRSDDAGDESDERNLLRVRMTLGEALRFAEGAMAVVRAGRPPCPLCGEPLDPQGHICVRRNGYLM